MKPVSEAVLEGLIHNLRTPLNLVLGYSQKIQDENGFSRKIYDAGIKMDDMLQQSWEALQVRLSDNSPTELNAWLQSELVVMHNILPLKHHYEIKATFWDAPVEVLASPRELGEIVEELLVNNISPDGMQQIELKVSSDGLWLNLGIEESLIWPIL